MWLKNTFYYRKEKEEKIGNEGEGVWQSLSRFFFFRKHECYAEGNDIKLKKCGTFLKKMFFSQSKIKTRELEKLPIDKIDLRNVLPNWL